MVTTKFVSVSVFASFSSFCFNLWSRSYELFRNSSVMKVLSERYDKSMSNRRQNIYKKNGLGRRGSVWSLVAGNKIWRLKMSLNSRRMLFLQWTSFKLGPLAWQHAQVDCGSALTGSRKPYYRLRLQLQIGPKQIPRSNFDFGLKWLLQFKAHPWKIRQGQPLCKTTTNGCLRPSGGGIPVPVRSPKSSTVERG